MKINFGGLFSCIGGFELAAEKMGWNNIFHCEIIPYRQRILKQHWPNAESHEDIKTTSFIRYRGKIDVLGGGWPCTGNSIANQTSAPKGLQHEASGLFYEYARAIDESQPKFIIAENVANVLQINRGNDFKEILRILASLGYNAEWRVCNAADEGAPHQRERLYTVAYPSSFRLQANESFFANVSKTKREKKSRVIAGATCLVGEQWFTEPPVLRMDDGISNRSHRIEALGNAVFVPLVVQIMKGVESIYNQWYNNDTTHP